MPETGSMSGVEWGALCLVLIWLATVAAMVICEAKSPANRAALLAWAARRRMTLLEVTPLYLRLVFPFMFFRWERTGAAYRIRVRNLRGKEWSGLATVGFRRRERVVKVRFDH